MGRTGTFAKHPLLCVACSMPHALYTLYTILILTAPALHEYHLQFAGGRSVVQLHLDPGDSNSIPDPTPTPAPCRDQGSVSEN